MVKIRDILRVEALLPSVRDTRKLTPSAEDAVEWAIINRHTPALLVDTLQPDLENVQIKLNIDGWSRKVQQRKGTGTGRMRYLKTIPRVYKNQIKGLAKWSHYLNLTHSLYFINIITLFLSTHIIQFFKHWYEFQVEYIN